MEGFRGSGQDSTSRPADTSTDVGGLPTSVSPLRDTPRRPAEAGAAPIYGSTARPHRSETSAAGPSRGTNLCPHAASAPLRDRRSQAPQERQDSANTQPTTQAHPRGPAQPGPPGARGTARPAPTDPHPPDNPKPPPPTTPVPQNLVEHPATQRPAARAPGLSLSAPLAAEGDRSPAPAAPYSPDRACPASDTGSRHAYGPYAPRCPADERSPMP